MRKNKNNRIRILPMAALIVLLVSIPIALYALFHARSVRAEWFNSAWSYRKSIRFGNTGSAVTDQKVLIAFDTVTPIAAGKMQSGCQDVRFTDAGGKLLQYYINVSGGAGVGCNDASSDFYVLMPSIVAGNNLIYIYYGNPSAPAGTVSANFGNTSFSPTSGPTQDAEEKSPGPVAMWKMDEGQGSTASDASGHGNSLTLTSTAWATQSATLSNRTQYLQFNGATSVASRANDTEFDFGTGSFSISAWIRHSSNITGTDVLITKYNTQGWKVYMNSSGFICFGIDDDSSYGPDDSACTTTSYADSTWHHIEVVKQGTTSITVYVDGIQKAQTTSLTATATLSTTATLYIGADSAGNTNWWDGWVDDVAIYPYARTANQIGLDVLGSSEASRSATLIGASASDPLANGLVGYWNMDETSGSTASDTSGNTNTGTVTNATSTGGKYGPALNFNGLDSTVNAGSGTSLDNMSSMTISAWIRPNSTGENSNGRIVQKGTGTTILNGFTFGMTSNTSNNELRFTMDYDPTTDLSIRSNANSVQLGVWQHVSVTFDGTGLTSGVHIYVNGIEVSSYSVTADGVSSRVDDSASTLYIGNNNTGSRTFDGGIDDLRIYNRALSPAEIRQLYAWAPGPIGWWKMDEGIGQTLNDSSGNGFTGTVGVDSSIASDDPKWVAGKFGSALNFDGVNDDARVADNDTLSFGNSSANSDKPYTFESWVYATQNTSRYIIDKSGEYSVRLGSDGRLICTQSDSSAGSYIGRNYSSGIAINGWHHVACSYDGTGTSAGTKIYVDGIRVDNADESAGTYTAMENLGNAFHLWESSEPWIGKLDDVRIYSYARTPSQVVEDMNGGHPASGGSLGSSVLHLKFDEGNGDVAYDSSPNRISGDLAGTSGSCPGAANCPAWYTSGKLNTALDFDGTNDYVAIVDNPIFDVTDTDDITISGWFNRDTSGTEDTIIAKRNSLAAVDTGWIVSVRDTDVFDFQLSDGTDEYQMTTTQTFTSAGWNFFTVIWDQDSVSNSKIFINGKQMPVTTSGTIGNVGDTSNALDLRVGTHSDGSDRFDGKIDDIRVYKFPVSDGQAMILYTQGASMVMGSSSTTSSGEPDNSTDRSFCVPGDTTSCAPPVGWWKFDEKTGTTTTYDSSGNERNGTLSGIGATSWKSGKLGSALYFDSGLTDLVEISDNDAFSIDTTNQFTVSAWVKPDDASNGTQSIVSKGAGNAYEWDVRLNSDGTANAYLYNSANGDYMTAQELTALSDNTWAHLTLVANLSTPSLSIYVNGVIGDTVDTTVNGTYTNDTAAVRIGRRADGTNNYTGMVDEVRIYNYARTPAQVAWDYNRGAPVARYTFDECQGSTAYNTARNADGKAAGMNGTITIGASGTYTSLGTCGSGTSTESWNAGTTGKYGSALGIDASNDYMAISDTNALDFTTGMTVSGWIFSSVLPTTSAKDANIVNKYLTTGNQRSYKLMVDKADNKYYFLVDGDGASGSTATAVSDVTFTTGTWHHVVGVFQNSTAYIYVDGVLQSTSATQGFSAVFNSTADVVIGMDANKTSAPNSGLYDDVMLFNYPVTAAQVKMLYNQGSAVRFGP